jgi:hypothetical protein
MYKKKRKKKKKKKKKEERETVPLKQTTLGSRREIGVLRETLKKKKERKKI